MSSTRSLKLRDLPARAALTPNLTEQFSALHVVNGCLTGQQVVDRLGSMKRDKVDKQARYVAEQLEKFLDLTNPRERVHRAKHIAEQATLLESYAVYEARAQEMSWAEIGKVYGYTRQGAQQRFGGA